MPDLEFLQHINSGLVLREEVACGAAAPVTRPRIAPQPAPHAVQAGMLK
jgi:hypothetical protein